MKLIIGGIMNWNDIEWNLEFLIVLYAQQSQKFRIWI